MMIFAYVGPEVVLPMASVVAAAFGVVMMVGRAPFRLASRWLRAARTGRQERGPRPRSPSERISFTPARGGPHNARCRVRLVGRDGDSPDKGPQPGSA